MTVIADESVDGHIVNALRAAGLEVVYVAEFAPGIQDEHVLALAEDHGALLVTADKDSGALVFRKQLVHSGVLLLRLAGMAPPAKAELVAAAVSQRLAELAGKFGVLTSRALRLRTPSRF